MSQKSEFYIINNINKVEFVVLTIKKTSKDEKGSISF